MRNTCVLDIQNSK